MSFSTNTQTFKGCFIADEFCDNSACKALITICQIIRAVDGGSVFTAAKSQCENSVNLSTFVYIYQSATLYTYMYIHAATCTYWLWRILVTLDQQSKTKPNIHWSGTVRGSRCRCYLWPKVHIVWCASSKIFTWPATIYMTVHVHTLYSCTNNKT